MPRTIVARTSTGISGIFSVTIRTGKTTILASGIIRNSVKNAARIAVNGCVQRTGLCIIFPGTVFVLFLDVSDFSVR